MEKNLIVVYESEVGTPFVVKPVGNQVLLLSPDMELTRLDVREQNWNNPIGMRPPEGESRFCYFGMTGEEVSGETMFALLIKLFDADCYDKSNYKRLLDTFSRWGISCPYEPLNVKIHLYKRESGSLTEYHFAGHNINDYMCGNCVNMIILLGETLQLIAMTGLFPEINIEVSQGSFTVDEFIATKIELSNMLRDYNSISLNFVKKEVE